MAFTYHEYHWPFDRDPTTHWSALSDELTEHGRKKMVDNAADVTCPGCLEWLRSRTPITISFLGFTYAFVPKSRFGKLVARVFARSE